MERIGEREKCDYCESFEQIPQEEREFLEGFMNMAYRWRIRNGGNGFEYFTGCEGGSCFEKKVLLGWSPTLLGTYGKIIKATYWWTMQRKNSWYSELIRIWEATQVNSPPLILEYDEEGEVVDFAEEKPGWSVPLNPPCPLKSKKDPEGMAIAVEDFRKVMNLLEEIGNSSLRYRREYQLILVWLIFEGINDNQVIAQRLSIKKNKAKDLKHQAIRLIKKLAAKRYPELLEKQEAYKNQETEAHEFVRTTAEERRANYRTYTPEEIEPGEPKIWKGEEAERYLEQLKSKGKKPNLS
jgi:hypothetical protein